MIIRAIAAIFGFLVRGAVFLGIAVLGGFGSAWALIHSGSSLTTTTVGPWVSWTSAGRIDADPYTRANTVRLARLPINPSLALTWQALNDGDGNRIHSSCAYSVDMAGFNATWWSLAIFDDRGGLIPNPANRHAFNMATAITDLDGGARITLARDARPGNWLPTTGAGKLVLMLTIQDPVWVANIAGETTRKTQPIMPTITRLSCR